MTSLKVFKVVNLPDMKVYWAVSRQNGKKILYKARTQEEVLNWIKRNSKKFK